MYACVHVSSKYDNIVKKVGGWVALYIPICSDKQAQFIALIYKSIGMTMLLLNHGICTRRLVDVFPCY